MVSASEVPRLAAVELLNVRGFENLALTLAADSRQAFAGREQAAGIVTAADRVPDFRSYSADDVLEDDGLFNVDAHNPFLGAGVDALDSTIAFTISASTDARRSASRSGKLARRRSAARYLEKSRG